MKAVLYVTEVKKLPNTNLLVSAENGAGIPRVTFEAPWRHSNVYIGSKIHIEISQDGE